MVNHECIESTPVTGSELAAWCGLKLLLQFFDVRRKLHS